MPTHTDTQPSIRKRRTCALWRALERRGSIPGTVPGVARPCGAQTSACSDRCRAATSRRKQGEAQAERDRHLRELWDTAVRLLRSTL